MNRTPPNALRDKGYGVTNWVVYGREGERMMMEILTSRKSEARLYRTVKDLDSKAFIMSHEPKVFFRRLLGEGNTTIGVEDGC